MRTSIYFNLHRKCYSVRAEEGSQKGRVIAHATRLSAQEVTPKVSEAGRQRVLAKGRKQVHAYLQGDLLAIEGTLTTAGLAAGAQGELDRVVFAELVETGGLSGHWESITYNPYKFTTFVSKKDHHPLVFADVAFFGRGGVSVSDPMWGGYSEEAVA